MMNSFKPPTNSYRVWFSDSGNHWLLYIAAALTLSVALHLSLFTILKLPGHTFLGSFANPEDLSVYLAAMRQGGEGQWLFQFTFTAEPMAPRVSYLLYLLLGHLGQAFNLSNLFLFHLARGVGGFLTLTIIYAWLRSARFDPLIAQDSFILITLGGGLGWLFILFGVLAPDLSMPEWTVFLSLAYAPHFILAVGAEVLLFTSLLHKRFTPTTRTLTAIVAACGLAVLYPYEIIPVILILLLFAIAAFYQRRDSLLTLLAPIAFAVSALIIAGAYYAFTARSDPFWEITYVAQNALPSPSLIELIAGLGLLLPLAIVAIMKSSLTGLPMRPFIQLLVIWFGVKLIFLYLPFSFQSRFSLGLYIPAAVLAVIGLHQVFIPWLIRQRQFKDPPRLALFIRRMVIGASILSTFMALTNYFLTTQNFPAYFWVSDSEAAAAEWLAENSAESDLILSSYQTGNYLPRVIAGKVFLGHLYITVDPQRKAHLTATFFAEDTSDEWRQNFVEEWGVTHIYYGQSEAALGPMPSSLRATEIYAQEGIFIYQLE
jgi:hypothetical protein